MKIRHVAMFSSDHDKLARFYTQVMGLEEVSRGGSPPGNTIYLTDGYINVAIIGSKGACLIKLFHLTCTMRDSLDSGVRRNDVIEIWRQVRHLVERRNTEH